MYTGVKLQFRIWKLYVYVHISFKIVLRHRWFVLKTTILQNSVQDKIRIIFCCTLQNLVQCTRTKKASSKVVMTSRRKFPNVYFQYRLLCWCNFVYKRNERIKWKQSEAFVLDMYCALSPKCSLSLPFWTCTFEIGVEVVEVTWLNMEQVLNWLMSWTLGKKARNVRWHFFVILPLDFTLKVNIKTKQQFSDRPTAIFRLGQF